MPTIREHLMAKQEFLQCLSVRFGRDGEQYRQACSVRFKEMVRVMEGGSTVSVQEATEIIKAITAGPFGKEEQDTLTTMVSAIIDDETPQETSGPFVAKTRAAMQHMPHLEGFFH